MAYERKIKLMNKNRIFNICTGIYILSILWFFISVVFICTTFNIHYSTIWDVIVYISGGISIFGYIPMMEWSKHIL